LFLLFIFRLISKDAKSNKVDIFVNFVDIVVTVLTLFVQIAFLTLVNITNVAIA
jgi:hypothetical protein